ncbi:MAG: T9SS type A sorting domain-containing protein [Sphingobacteriaceae bacterium]|nr:T9SS type A sorting domain-containing protein [Sphingobacteriaceae bacterium]
MKALPFYNPNTIAASWNWGDGNTTVGLYPSHTYSAAGIYNICLTVTVSCTSGPITSSTCVNSNIFKMNGNEETTAMIYINVINPLAASIQTSSKTDISFDIFPNPNNGEVSLQISNSPLKEVGIAIYNMIGENVYKSTLTPTNGSINAKLNLNELANGTYFIRVEGQNTSKKLIILK